MIKISARILFDENEIKFLFIRASGPGGQNVNKVATAVQLRFDVKNSKSIPENLKDRLLKRAGKKASNDGIIIIEAKRFRTQEKNKKDAIDRLIHLITKSTQEIKVRRRTRPTKSSSEKRIELKKQKSKLKSLRKNISISIE